MVGEWNGEQRLMADSKTCKDTIEAMRRAIEIERDALSGVMDRLGPEADKAVELIYASKGQLIVTGMGKSGLIGRKVAATLASTGTPAFFLHPAEAIHGDLGIVSSRDVVLAISNSGETEEIVALLPHLKRFGVHIISLTGKPGSTLGQHSDVVIDVGVEREADPLNIAPTASTTVQLAMGDALAAALVERRGFCHDQYAIFHPGGSLGRKLLWLVRDLMHKDDDVPLARDDASLREVVLTMTSKRIGATFIVDADQRLRGILTDGDLRRIMQVDANPMDLPIMNVMARLDDFRRERFRQNGESMKDYKPAEPKTVRADMLAAEALRIMEDLKITVLAVVDEEKRPVGALHLHDLIKAGLA